MDAIKGQLKPICILRNYFPNNKIHYRPNIIQPLVVSGDSILQAFPQKSCTNPSIYFRVACPTHHSLLQCRQDWTIPGVSTQSCTPRNNTGRQPRAVQARCRLFYFGVLLHKNAPDCSPARARVCVSACVRSDRLSLRRHTSLSDAEIKV